MYGMKFSLWLTGAVSPQAVAGRHSSTRPLAGGRLGAGIDVHHHDRISASIGLSLQNGAMDVRQSDTGRHDVRFSPAHVCVHSTTQARSQDFPRSYSGEKWTLRLKAGGGGSIW